MIIKKYNKAFSLIETMLSLILIVLFTGAFMVCTNVDSTKNVKIETKVSDYVTLNKYVKYNAALSGKRASLIIISNKIGAIMEESDGFMKEIRSLQPQVESLNDSTIFECLDTNIITYLPTEAIEDNNPIMITINDDTNKVAFVNIGDFEQISIVYTNVIQPINIDSEETTNISEEFPYTEK